jgi:hypothetical protein
VKAAAHELVDQDERAYAFEQMEAVNQKRGRSLGSVDRYAGTSRQRLYMARPLEMWINMSQKDANGFVIQDKRYRIEAAGLAA